MENTRETHNQDSETELKTFGPLTLVCVPFDESKPPGYAGGAYSGIRGERLLLKREINGQEVVVEIWKGNAILCREKMYELGRILLFTDVWPPKTHKEKPMGPGRS